MTQTTRTSKPTVADFGPDHPFTGVPIIHTYTREQALDDGVLIDLTPTARARGFRWPIACTERLWQSLIAAGIDPENNTDGGPEIARRIGQVLNCLLMAVQGLGNKRDEYVWFTALTDAGCSKAWARAHGDDDGAPCITIMLMGED